MSGGGAAPAERGRRLLALARAALVESLGGAAAPEVGDGEGWLAAPAACFVTLTQEGRLRGCIGSMEARRPLLEEVRHSARAAALRDPRFPPLAAEELARTRIEVSLLSALEPLQFADEEDLLAQLRPGIDGLLLEHGPHRGTFLPAVWESLPEPASFWAQLKRKAGLAADFWSDQMRVWRYTTTCWKEPEPEPAG